MAAIAVARRAVQPRCPTGSPAPVWPRDARQSVSSGAGGATTAVALLQRAHADRVRAGALPATGRLDLLLRRHQVSLPVRVARRAGGQASAGDVGVAGCAAIRRLHAADRDSRGGAGATAG